MNLVVNKRQALKHSHFGLKLDFTVTFWACQKGRRSCANPVLLFDLTPTFSIFLLHAALSPPDPLFIKQCVQLSLSSVLTASRQSVKQGLVSLCPPEWQCRVCDTPERYRSPIRSATLINLFKHTVCKGHKKTFQPTLESH